MNIRINHFEQMIQQLPPHADNPVMGIIAEADPMDLQRNANWAVTRYADALDSAETRATLEASTAASVNRQGENIRTIYADFATDMQNLQSQLLEQGLTPDAELMDQAFVAAETAELPVEILGHAVDDTEALRAIWPMRSEDDALAIQRDYFLAKELLTQRNRLGRIAKVGTWVGGVLACAAVSAGLMHMVGHAEEQKPDHNAVAETVVDASIATIVATSGLVPTIVLANKAQRHQARRRARRAVNS